MSDWEPLPLFHVFFIEGVPAHGWIHDVAVWAPCAARLEFIVDAMNEPTGLRTSQSDGSKEWLAFPEMTWSDVPLLRHGSGMPNVGRAERPQRESTPRAEARSA